MPNRIRKRHFGVALLVIILVMFACHRQLLPYALHWLDIGEPPVQSKAVFVLLGDENSRPCVAAAIVNAGYAEEVIIARNEKASVNPQDPPGNEVCERMLLHRGVPADKILLMGTGATNTMDEIDILNQYLNEHPEAIVTVVTTHFHTRRTRWSLRQKLGVKADRLRFVSAPHDDFDADTWWLFAYGFELVIVEYIKLIGYWFLYGRALWYVGLALVLLAGWYQFVRQPNPKSTSSDGPAPQPSA